MLRIKYMDYSYREGYKISIRKYQSESTGAYYRVLLDENDPEKLRFFIRNERNKEYVYKSGEYTNGNALRKAARKKLSYFGVATGKENRLRNFGLCEKGYSQKQWEAEEMYKIYDEEEKE